MPEPRTAGALTQADIETALRLLHSVALEHRARDQYLAALQLLRAALAHAERERDAAQKLAVEVEEALVAEMHVVARDSGQYRLCSDLLRAMYREVIRKRLLAAPPPAEGGER